MLDIISSMHGFARTVNVEVPGKTDWILLANGLVNVIWYKYTNEIPPCGI